MTKREKSRLKIMHAAKGLFEKNGPDGVTFSQIAEEADVCRTTVFNHFAGTRELMLAIAMQEIQDVTDFCAEKGYRGRELIEALFDKLIEDTAYYPALTSRLINNAVLSNEKENPVRVIEELTAAGLRQDGTAAEETDFMVTAIEGAYFGLINHYHINNKAFEAGEMKAEFHRLLAMIFAAA